MTTGLSDLEEQIHIKVTETGLKRVVELLASIPGLGYLIAVAAACELGGMT
ncbi:MAG: hypothetical protein ACFFFG_01910 [Candidatus Thorarchaeota archaeon]